MEFESGLVREYFDVGDVAPTVTLVDQDGRSRPITRMAGAPAVLHLISAADDKGSDAVAITEALRDRGPAFEGATVAVVRRAPVHLNLAYQRKHKLVFSVLSDEQGALAFNLGAPDRSVTAIFDRSSRIVAVLPVEDTETHVDKVLAALPPVSADLLPPPPGQAPIMLVSDVLSPEYCRYLIEVHQTRGNEPSGFMLQTKDGAKLVQDETVKRRHDHVIVRGAPLETEIRHLFERRIIPEIGRVAHCAIGSHEDFKIVRYSGEERGFFKAHRDNTSEASKARKFAVTLNLNTGAYDGGQLVFPEYGDFGYVPEIGQAAIFSASLLHEVRPITRGERYVLLAFLR